jgi:hypothetical protein
MVVMHGIKGLSLLNKNVVADFWIVAGAIFYDVKRS